MGKTAQVSPQRRVVYVGTGGFFWDRDQAAQVRERLFPPAVQAATVAVLDLGGLIPTPGTLQEMILPLAQRIKGGEYGEMVLVISTVDPGVADFVHYMAVVHDLPIFVTSDTDDLRNANPVNKLTATEKASLVAIGQLGGTATSAELAQHLGLEATAAGNRLVNLSKRGLVFRVGRPRQEGDLFLDPRIA